MKVTSWTAFSTGLVVIGVIIGIHSIVNRESSRLLPLIAAVWFVGYEYNKYRKSKQIP